MRSGFLTWALVVRAALCRLGGSRNMCAIGLIQSALFGGAVPFLALSKDPKFAARANGDTGAMAVDCDL